MKKLLVVFLLPAILYSQTNYYDGTQSKTGDELKSVLFNKIKNHKRYPYTSGSTDVWDILKTADRDPANASNVLLIYTGFSVNAAQEYNSGQGWNREHVWAKSHGFPSSGDTAYTDAHHLHAADISTNSARGNKDFDNGGTEYFDGGTIPTGCYADNDSWEPRDAVKGDVARSMFYMSARYENSSNYDLELVDYTPTNSNTPLFGKLSTLLEWNRNDPPDDFERRRNNVVYYYQKNRNPFIDHPEFADKIYLDEEFIILDVESIFNNQVVITYSEAPGNSVLIPDNYKLLNSQIKVEAVVENYNGNDKSVLIYFEEALTDSMEILQVSNIESVNSKTIAANSIYSFIVNPLVSSISDETNLPSKFELSQNYPNPFNPTTRIRYSVPASFSPQQVMLNVFDLLGGHVAQLVNRVQAAGEYSVEFNASTSGNNLTSGIYIYELTSGDFKLSRKMLLLK